MGNLQKITRAMEMVARSKMKRAVDQAEKTRRYALESLQVLSSLSREAKEKNIFLDADVADRERVLIVYIAADRGLCGGYNITSGKKLNAYLADKDANKANTDVLAIGKYARIYAEKAGLNVVSTHSLPDKAASSDIKPVSDSIMELFESEVYSHAVILYTNYISPFSQETLLVDLLPLNQAQILDAIDRINENSKTIKSKSSDELTKERVDNEENLASKNEYIFEPSEEEVVSQVIPQLLHVFVFQAYLEAVASEHSSRMVAMKNATENADSLGKELTLKYNRARQAAVTSEILEISAGADAVSS